MSVTPPREMTRFTVLDGWRGLAALFVALFHLPVPGHFYLLPFVRGSYLFVDFFFVLSGFIITHSSRDRLRRPGGVASFVIRRFGRLWPLHFAMLMIFVVAVFSIHGIAISLGFESSPKEFRHINDLQSFISSFFLLHGMGTTDGLSWNHPSWSISVEFWVYLVFAAIMTMVRSRITLASAAVMGAGLGAILLLSDNFIRVTYNYGFFRGLYGFFMGYLVYRLWERTHGEPLGYISILECLAIAMAVIFVSRAAGGPLSLGAPIAFAFVVLIFSYEQGIVSRVMRTTVFRKLGEWSYSIYMVHALVVLVLMHGIRMYEAVYRTQLVPVAPPPHIAKNLSFLLGDFTMNFLALGYLAVVVGLAALTYRFIEQPSRRYFNGIARKYEGSPAKIPVSGKATP